MNMSFFLTTRQMEAREKDVTRRLGWTNARVGQVVRPVVKGQGLKKGETVRYLACGPIRFTKVEREPLGAILGRPGDVAREGFPEMDVVDFVNMFCDHNGCEPDDMVTRIEFEYVEAAS